MLSKSIVRISMVVALATMAAAVTVPDTGTGLGNQGPIGPNGMSFQLTTRILLTIVDLVIQILIVITVNLIRLMIPTAGPRRGHIRYAVTVLIVHSKSMRLTK